MKTLSNDWQKPTLSGANGQCVEARLTAINDVPLIEVRNSNYPHLNVVRFTPAEWDTFIRAVADDGEFRLPA